MSRSTRAYMMSAISLALIAVVYVYLPASFYTLSFLLICASLFFLIRGFRALRKP